MNFFKKYVRNSFFLFLSLLMILSSKSDLLAANNKAEVDIRQGKGFARMVFSFQRSPKVTSKTISTVFVINFKKPVLVDLAAVSSKLSNVITIARRDPDGYGLRFAMNRQYKVNVMQAGHFLVVDFLAKNWRGPLPGMPQDVVDKLAKLAAVARLAAAERERQKALQIDPLLVELHHVSQPTFNRIQFNWNRFVTAKFSRKGDEVVVSFGGRAVPNLAHLKINPPNNLVRIHHELGKNSLKVIMKVLKGTSVRAFREGKNYVVDLTVSKYKKLSKIEKKLYAATRQAGGEDKKIRKEEILLQGDEHVSKEAKSVRNQKTPEITSLQAKGQVTKKQQTKPSVSLPAKSIKKILAKKPVTFTQSELLPQLEADLSSPDKNKADNQYQIIDKNSERGSFNPAVSKPIAAKNKKIASKTAKNRGIEVIRDENSVQLGFPFRKDQVAAAIFQRNKHLSVLFDSEKKLDLMNLKAQLGGIVKDIRVQRLDKSQLIEFFLSGPWLTSVSQQSDSWTISIGDLVTGSSKKISPVKRVNKAGAEEIFIPVVSIGRLHQIKDRDSGDDLLVVTSRGPANSIKNRREHVEFQLLKTIHGVVVHPLSDELRISKSQLGVKIIGNNGLFLSGNLQNARAVKKKPHDKRRAQARKIKFAGPAFEDIAKFKRRTLELEKKIAARSGRARGHVRLELAQHWLARGLAPEGLGMLEVLATENVEIIKNPVFRLMRGMSYVMLGRHKLARKDLETNDLKDNPHASLWRAVSAYRQKKFKRAFAEIKRGELAISAYLPGQQAMFRLSGADVAIERKDPGFAGYQLDNIPQNGISPMQQGMARFLEGRLLELQNRPRKALQLYADAIRANIRPVTAKAVFRLTDLRLRIGDIKPEVGIDIFERLSIIWRGDEVELQVLHRLADLYLQNGQYRNAFSLMETAVRAYPTSDQAMALQYRMKAQFVDLFLQGKADDLSPVKALALFYDHKHLTPLGRLGDEMIRRLADRLINVDLLDKAASLLDHQVTRRLKGAGRAQVAVRLAMIHLLQHRPKLALKTIYRTRQSSLPTHVREARKLLEARAYAELGRSGAVLELLASDDSVEAGEIKSLALWNGQKWTQAGEQYEKLLGNQWQLEKGLSSKARMHVLRAAISYTLGDDRMGVDRLRDKYAAKMAKGSDAEAFAMITDPLKSNARGVDRLARDIADIDTLEAFIQVFRKRLDKSSAPRTTGTVN